MTILGVVYSLIDHLRDEVLMAPDSEYRRGYLDALELVETDLQNEVGEDE